jgi:hypothetical protein
MNRTPNVTLFLAAPLALLAAAPTPASAQCQAWAWGPIEPEFQDVLVPMVQSFPGELPVSVANRLKALPSGRRILILQGYTEPMVAHPEDACRKLDQSGELVNTGLFGPWSDHGRQAVQAQMSSFFQTVKEHGGQVDSLVLDHETDFRIGRFLGSDESNIVAIREDPRWPALAARLQIDALTRDSVWYDTLAAMRWTFELQRDFDASLESAVSVPFRACWPSATISNYGSAPISMQFPIISESGFPVARGGTGFGTHDSFEFYGCGQRWLKQAKLNGIQLNDSPFDIFRLMVHRVRSIDTASAKPMYPWIGSYGLGARSEHPELAAENAKLSLTPYWRETVIQLVMHGSNTLLLYNPWAWRPQDDPALFNVRSDQELLAGIIRDLNVRLGPTASATSASTWMRMPHLDERVIATARQISGGRLWRFSLAPGVKGIAVPFENGAVQLLRPVEGDTGLWFVETDENRLALRTDHSDVAFAEVSDEMSWPDVNTDGVLDNVDRQAWGHSTGAVLGAEGNLVSLAIQEWTGLARSSMDAPSDVALAMRSALQDGRWGTKRIGPALLSLGNAAASSTSGNSSSGTGSGSASSPGGSASSGSSSGSTASASGTTGSGSSSNTGSTPSTSNSGGATSSSTSTASQSGSNSNSQGSAQSSTSTTTGAGSTPSQPMTAAQAKAQAKAAAQAQAKAAKAAKAAAKAAAQAQAKVARAAAMAARRANAGTSAIQRNSAR